MNSFIPWVGGKKILRKEIMSHFPEKNEFSRYIEVFGGAGWVLFGSEKHAKIEVFNDLNSNLVNLFRCVKFHPDEVKQEILSIYLNSREFFENWVAEVEDKNKTDIQRAAIFYMIIKLSYMANLRHFHSNDYNILNQLENFPDIQKRLQNVTIENSHYESLVKKYDKKETLFYCDPPYLKAENYYSVHFDKSNHIKLRDILAQIKGRFVLSYNDDEYIKKIYKEFTIIEVFRRQNLFVKKNGIFKELIIKNF